MMGNALPTWDEDHTGRAVITCVDAIMSGPGGELANLILPNQLNGRSTNGINAILVNFYGFAPPDLLNVHSAAVFLRDLFTEGSHALSHTVHGIITKMLNVDTEGYFARDSAGALLLRVDDSDRRQTFVCPSDLVYTRDHATGSEQGVGSTVDRCRATVLGSSGDCDN